MGFFRCFDTHQSFSSSNEQTAIALFMRLSFNLTITLCHERDADRSPLATANLSSLGLQRTNVAARLMRRRTRVGFQTRRPVSGSCTSVQTYALRSCEHVTMRLVSFPQSIEVIVLSCYNVRVTSACYMCLLTRVLSYLCKSLLGSPVTSLVTEDGRVVRVQAHGDVCEQSLFRRDAGSMTIDIRVLAALKAWAVRGTCAREYALGAADMVRVYYSKRTGSLLLTVRYCVNRENVCDGACLHTASTFGKQSPAFRTGSLDRHTLEAMH